MLKKRIKFAHKLAMCQRKIVEFLDEPATEKEEEEEKMLK